MTGTLIHLFLAMLVFVGGHFLLSSTFVRPHLVRMLGEGAFAGLYSALMIAAIVWVVAAYRVAPPKIVWDLGPHINWVPLVAMPFALMLAVLGLLSRNPTAVMGEKALAQTGNLPRGPATITRHAFLAGTALWGIAHLLANGDMASILLFGGMSILAIGGMYAIDRKRAVRHGAAWDEFAKHTSRFPFAAALSGRVKIDWAGIGWTRPALGLLLYVVLVLEHDRFFGVPARALY
jgi:uncharacterized membrane protein